MAATFSRRSLLGKTAAAAAAAAAGGVLLGSPRARARSFEPAPSGGVWLPGDLHTHSCYSHDVYCALPASGIPDDNTGPDESYTAGLPVPGKYAEGRARGLKYLAVTDHNDVRSIADLAGTVAATGPGAGMIALPGYEHSIHGHAHLLGATKLYDVGDQAADRINDAATQLRAAGGVFQANHPAYKMALDAEYHACNQAGCADCRLLHWQYEFDVRPDTVEVWNPSVARSDASETYWECWLDRGEQIGGTGGSDSHWVSLHAVAGPGQPTTWVYAREASLPALLEGLRAGRTTISGQPPALGGPQLLLDAPTGGIIGDTVTPGTTLRVTAPGLHVPAVVRIRANGEQLLEQDFDPGATMTFRAPSEAGWVRAILLTRATSPVDPINDVGDATPMRDGMLMLAMTSPMYLRRPV